jgi:hypothetical protein
MLEQRITGNDAIHPDSRRASSGTWADEVRTDPVDAYWRAFHAHNAQQIDTDTYLRILNAMDDWVPDTPQDFIRKFCAMFDDAGALTDRRLDKLVAHAHRLLDDRFRSG